MFRRVVTFMAVAFASLALAGSVLAATSSVNIGEANSRYSFRPAKVFVHVGDSVQWTNGSDAPHTVTSNSGTELASPTFGAGATFSHTFGAAGTFAYHCTIHAYMKGSVVVLAAGVTAPATDTVPATASVSRAWSFWPLVLLALLAVGVGVIGAGLWIRRRV